MNTQDANPYASPSIQSDPLATPMPMGDGRLTPERIAEARRRLEAHLKDPERIEEDRRAARPRFRWVVWSILVLLMLALILLITGAVQQQSPALVGFAVTLGIIAGIILFVVVRNDRTVVRREQATTPVAALRGWLHAMRMGRAGYVWAGMGPLARDQDRPAPAIAPVVTAPGLFAMGQAATVRDWLRSFAVAGKGQVRWMKILHIEERERQGDVAVVSAQVRFQSWPQWANITSVVLFLFVRVVGIIVGAILYYALRKRTSVTLDKTLIQGRDGQWYLVDAGLADGLDG